VLACIRHDSAELQFMFYLSQAWFQILVEDVMVSDNPFYVNNSNQNHQPSASMEAKTIHYDVVFWY
jgi:hypothetical protein